MEAAPPPPPPKPPDLNSSSPRPRRCSTPDLFSLCSSASASKTLRSQLGSTPPTSTQLNPADLPQTHDLLPRSLIGFFHRTLKLSRPRSRPHFFSVRRPQAPSSDPDLDLNPDHLPPPFYPISDLDLSPPSPQIQPHILSSSVRFRPRPPATSSDLRQSPTTSRSSSSTNFSRDPNGSYGEVFTSSRPPSSTMAL